MLNWLATATLGASLLSSGTALANEGMWRPDQLPDFQSEFDSMNAEIRAEEWADIKSGPLGSLLDLSGCSAAFVSPDGLVATAFHCIWPHLQFASRDGENLIEDGFYAATQQEERWGGPSGRVRLTLSVKDVTDDVMAGTKKLDGKARATQVADNRKKLVKRCESEVGIHCSVVSFDHGTVYRLTKQREYKDIRVVYSPPRNVGYFGGDSDNWHWPRHSADFAFIRVYATPSNQPTGHQLGNVPYHPAVYLPVAKGPSPGDFVLVAGYPARTFRWLTAAEIDYAQNEDYPRRVETNLEVLHILRQSADRYRDVGQKVQGRVLSLNNQTQYLEGNLDAFRKLHAVSQKWAFEKDLSQWIIADGERAERFGNTLDQIHALHAEQTATDGRNHVAREMRRHTLMYNVSLRLYKLSKEARKKDADRQSGYQNRDRPEFAEWLDTIDAEYDWRVDQQVLRYFLLRALSLPEGLRIPEMDAWFASLPHTGTVEQRIDKELERLYIHNIELTDADKRRSLMDTSPWFLESSGNPWFNLAARMHPFYERQRDNEEARSGDWREARAQYITALKEFIPAARPRFARGQILQGLYYSDANRTLRVTFGKVDGYFPRDGLIAAPRSRLEGILEKHGPGDYDTHPPLLQAIRDRDYGNYADPTLDSVSVNFLSTVDTSLGNSGSPTINDKGEWVGILFDGNYESMSGDWLFEERLTRSIHTDSSYVLWYLDAVEGATSLLKELGFERSVGVQPATE
jgi:hypothetical protein